MQLPYIKLYSKQKIIPKILLSVLSAIFIFTSGCTMVKMGGLFLSGTFDRQNFKKEINFTFQRGLVLIPVKINGSDKSYRFILDTGASFNVISSEIAVEFGLKAKAESSISDAVKKRRKLQFVKLKDIEIGGLHFSNTAAAVLDLVENQALKCYAADGVIGMNLIRFVPIWQIDFPKQKMVITDDRGLVNNSPQSYKIPFNPNIQRIPVIKASIDGVSNMRFIVDSGFTGSVSGNLEQWEAVHKANPDISFVKQIGEVSSGALGVKVGTSYAAKVKVFNIGDWKRNAVQIDFVHKNLPKIGSAFFKNQVFTLNWAEKYITATTPPDSKLDETRDSFGFWFGFRVEEQCLYVNFLIERSSAWDVGLKIGDKIVAVNGKKMLPLTSDEYCRYFFRPELLLGEGAVLDLEIDRGEKRMNFTLEKRNLFK